MAGTVVARVCMRKVPPAGAVAGAEREQEERSGGLLGPGRSVAWGGTPCCGPAGARPRAPRHPLRPTASLSSPQASPGTCVSLTWTSVQARLAGTAPSAWTGPTPTPACARKVRGRWAEGGQAPGSGEGAGGPVMNGTLPTLLRESPGVVGAFPGAAALSALGLALQATRGRTARWTLTSVTPILATTGRARMVLPPSPACAGRATRATTARPTSTSVTASPAATAAPARTATTPTCASASKGPQVPGGGRGGGVCVSGGRWGGPRS